MQELIVNIAPNLASKLPDFYKALGDTMLMVLWSGLISYSGFCSAWCSR